jgi:DNA-binding SARP family transcriptional activator
LHTLTTLGGLSILGPDGAPTGLAPRKRALALLAFSASAAKEGISRDRAMALLWPELDAGGARNNLKQTVFAIRHTLGVDVFDHTTTTLRLDTSEISVDLHHFEHALAVGAHEDAAGDYAGPFLDGFFLPNLSEFDRWVERVRQRLDLGYLRSLETLAVRARLRGDRPAAIHWYRLLVEHDPVSTSCVLGLMSTLAESSEPLAALECYQRHVKLLREEFDAEPDPKIQHAADVLRRGLAYRPGEPAYPAASADDTAIPSLPPLFVEPPRTARRISGPIVRPLRQRQTDPEV